MTEQDQSKYTAASMWATTAANTEKDLELPSGAVCRVRKPGMEQVLMSGMMDMVDVLGGEGEKLADPKNRAERRAAQQQGVRTVQEAQESAGSNFMDQVKNDPTLFGKMIKMVDTITCITVIIPTVHPMPQMDNPEFDPTKPAGINNPKTVDDPSQCVEGLFYPPMIDIADKFAIMDFGMGDIQKMQQFRDASDALGATLTGEESGDEVVPTPGD